MLFSVRNINNKVFLLGMVTKKPAKKTSRKTMSAKEKKAQLEKKTKEALKAVNTLMKRESKAKSSLLLHTKQ